MADMGSVLYFGEYRYGLNITARVNIIARFRYDRLVALAEAWRSAKKAYFPDVEVV